MNNINRGVLIGIRITLTQIAETLEKISDYEQMKEIGDLEGTPIEHRGITSDSISSASVLVYNAVDKIEEVVPQQADFEDM